MQHRQWIKTIWVLSFPLILIVVASSAAAQPRVRPSQFSGLSDEEKARLVQGLSDEEKARLVRSLTIKQEEISKPEETSEIPQSSQMPGQETIEQKTTEKETTVSRIEKILSGDFPRDISRELRQFGYEFFDKDISTFAPVTNVPVGDDYVVGPGDSFIIHLWGNVEETQQATISRDGRITLRRLGTLSISGMTFADLKNYLNHKYRQHFPDFKMGVSKMSISMESLRAIEVFIVGEVNHPGTYSVSPLSTMITALYAAGGPRKNGSLRNVKLFRNSKLIQELDLYHFLIKGFKGNDMRLQSGDTIFVPVLGPCLGIAGNVRRPAIYEMRGEQTIGEILELSGGVLPTGRLQNVVIERVENHQRRTLRSFNLDPLYRWADENLKMPLKDGDVVKIYPVHNRLREVVYLEGHVKYPMEYELRPGIRLRDLIASYEYLLPEPYLPQAEILRLVPPDLHPEIIQFNLGALLAGDDNQNFVLQDMDRVVIYPARDKKDIPQVNIKGEVRNPGTYRLYTGMMIKDLIFKAGNLTRKAYLQTATLTRITFAGKEADILKLSFSPEKALQASPAENLRLQPDDEVFIRQIPNYTEALNRRILLEGEFVFPGEYAFSEGDRLSTLIQKAGGLTAEGFPSGAVLLRESVKKTQQEQLDEYITRLEEDILTSMTQAQDLYENEAQAVSFKAAMIAKKELVEKLRAAQPTGRMVIDLNEILVLPSSPYNFELRPGDRLIVTKRPDHVNVMGEVYNPTALLAKEGKTVDYFLNRVGGMTGDADKGQMFVVRANGSVVSKSQSGFFGLTGWDDEKRRWTLGGFGSTKIYAGDTIIVPRETRKYLWWTITKDIVDVAYKIAVSAGVIAAVL